MSAHVPRNVFAKSFVTVALPIVVACGHEDPPPTNPPTPTATPTDSTAPLATQNPPPPTDTATLQPTGRLEQIAWSVSMSGGKCHAMMNVTCPQGATCNPPPPTDYACPKGVSQNEYPLQLTPIAGTSNCKAMYTEYFGSGTCPPGDSCNPPPPQEHTMTVPCPK